MKRRGKGRRYGYEDGGRRGWVRWNELGGGDDDDDEEDYDQEEEDERDREEEEYERGAGAGAAEETKRIPYEERWEVDLEQEGRTNGFEAAKVSPSFPFPAGRFFELSMRIYASRVWCLQDYSSPTGLGEGRKEGDVTAEARRSRRPHLLLSSSLSPFSSHL